MSYILHKKHTKVNFTSGNAGRDYIVIHYTGNKTDTAEANANYFYDTYRGASAHYFVDDINVYEVVSPNNTAWSVGVNYGSNNLFGKCTNVNSINIEMCSTNGRITEATFNNTVELTKKLMKKYNIPASRVVRHYDVCSKQCPAWKGWIGSDTSLWDKFKKSLVAVYTTTKSATGGYTTNETDPIGGTSKKKITIPKGVTVKWIKDDNYGWSQVEYKGKKYWVVNGKLSKSGLSKYKTITFKKGHIVRRLNSKKNGFETKTALKKNRKFTVICIVTSGKYKNWYYCKRNGKYYYCKPLTLNK